MQKTVYIVIGCDTDPDRIDFLDNVPTDTLTWRGMLEGIPETKEKVKDITDSNGSSPIFTWCLRADHQIKETFGSYNYVLEKNKSFFHELESTGDEIGWHPHFFKFDKPTSKWYQDFKDKSWQVNMLREAYAEFQSALPGRAKSVRMGWIYHNDQTFAALDKLGIKIDFSGIPRLSLLPKNDNVKSVNFFDWEQTPNHPYYPSINDYRKIAGDNEDSYKTLEAPNFASDSLLWSLISGAVLVKKMKDIKPIFKAIQNPVYWITITGKTKLFAPIVNQLKKELQKKDEIYFVTYFHPDELLPNNSSLYSLQNLHDNLNTIRTTAHDCQAEIKYIKACDLPGLVK